MDEAWHSLEADPSGSRLPTINRACQGCNRKKIRCDMRRPTCGLCARVGAPCAFPVRQKHSTARARARVSQKATAPSPSRMRSEIVSPGEPNAHSQLHDQARHEQCVPDDGTRGYTIARQDPICAPLETNEPRFRFPSFDTPPGLAQSNSMAEGHRDRPKSQFQSLAPDSEYLIPSPTASDSRDNGWFIPDAVACELIVLFFDTIQPWLPILHHPQFYEKYVRTENQSTRILDRQRVSDHDAFLINCMFALAARFSRSSFFTGIDPPLRGQAFAERAAAIKDSILKVVEEPSLEFVKGCAMLAFYNLTAGHAAPGALLTSLCVRFAYDLGLDAIDDECHSSEDGPHDDVTLADVEAWVHKEELRRLWWVIYELDCAVSTFCQQPYGIERGTIQVFLPVSDHHWFNQLPLRSSYLIQSASETWKSLQGCPNQSPRAWYLVTNFLKSCIADAARQSKQHTTENQSELENALACHKLALPAIFQLRSLSMDDTNFGDGNWIVSTNFMILACDTLIERIKWSVETPEPSFDAVGNAALFGKHFYSSLVRISQVWPPEYIPLNSPLISCCVINPWDALLALRDQPKFQSYELSKLLLGHYSRFWMIGSALLRLITLIHEGRDASTYPPGSKERDILKRFSILCPSSCSKKRDSVASKLNAGPFQNESTDNRLSAGTLPSPSLTNFESPGDLQWFPVLWDSLQEFSGDVDGHDKLQSPPDGAYTEQIEEPSHTIALSQLRLMGNFSPLDPFDTQFVTL